MQSPERPVVFYDGGCPICRREIGFYQRLDREDAIDWRDIARQPKSLEGTGVDWGTAMRRFHVLDVEGRMRTGVDAFALVWEQLPGWWLLARVVRGLRLVGPLERLYGWYADRRYARRCKTNTCGPG